MNRTHFEHIVYAVLMQLPFGLFGYWWVGAAFAITGAVAGASTSGTFLLNAGDTVTCNQYSGAYLWTNDPDSTFSVALVTQI